MGISESLGAALACAALAGCSFTISEPSAPRGERVIRCKESRTLPVIDLVTGSTFALGGIGLRALLQIRAPNASDASEVTGVAVGALAIGIVYGISGIGGLGKTRRCREAKARSSASQ